MRGMLVASVMVTGCAADVVFEPAEAHPQEGAVVEAVSVYLDHQLKPEAIHWAVPGTLFGDLDGDLLGEIRESWTDERTRILGGMLPPCEIWVERHDDATRDLAHELLHCFFYDTRDDTDFGHDDPLWQLEGEIRAFAQDYLAAVQQSM